MFLKSKSMPAQVLKGINFYLIWKAMIVLIAPGSPALHFTLPMKTCGTSTHIGRVLIPIRFVLLGQCWSTPKS